MKGGEPEVFISVFKSWFEYLQFKAFGQITGSVDEREGKNLLQGLPAGEPVKPHTEASGCCRGLSSVSFMRSTKRRGTKGSRTE